MGTAPNAEVWLLLSYAEPFGAKALEESDLPGQVKQRLSAELERIPHSRLLLIKPQAGPSEGRIESSVVVGRETDPLSTRFEINVEPIEPLADHSHMSALNLLTSCGHSCGKLSPQNPEKTQAGARREQ